MHFCFGTKNTRIWDRTLQSASKRTSSLKLYSSCISGLLTLKVKVKLGGAFSHSLIRCFFIPFVSAVLVAMSCFALLCEEADIRCGQDDLTATYLLPNYHVYQELAISSTILTTGRAALQKRIMALLRKIEHCTQGCSQAWEDTFMNWEATTKMLVSYPKSKGEYGEGQSCDSLHRSVSKRRASHQSTDHELEDQINEWANMTGRTLTVLESYTTHSFFSILQGSYAHWAVYACSANRHQRKLALPEVYSWNHEKAPCWPAVKVSTHYNTVQ